MISLMPILWLGAFSVNTSGNGFNYKGWFEWTSHITLFSTYNSTYDEVDTIEGYITFHGDFYCNNQYNYLFEMRDIGWTMRYNQNDIVVSSAGDNIAYRFDDRDGSLDFSGYVDLNYEGSIGITFDSVNYFDELNNTFYSNSIYDSEFEGTEITINYTIDFMHNDTWIDNFGYLVQSRINGLSDGNQESFNQGYTSGFNDGYIDGHRDGRDEGYDLGFNQGYSQGYNTGFNEGFDSDSTALTIFSGIVAIGMIPVNFFLAIFNFEILGINLASFVSSLLSVACVIIVVKHVLAIKDD